MPQKVVAGEGMPAALLAEAREAMIQGLSRAIEGIDRFAEAATVHGRLSSGLLDGLVSQAPRLEADVHILDRDHREFPWVIGELRERAQRLLDDIETVVGRATAHNELAEHLIYEAYGTDIGGG